MSNIIKQKFKHGIFSYYSNDQYIGKSLSEYGEWSEAEVGLLKQLLDHYPSLFSESIMHIPHFLTTYVHILVSLPGCRIEHPGPQYPYLPIPAT